MASQSKGYTLRGVARTEGVIRPLAKMAQELNEARKKADLLGRGLKSAGEAGDMFGKALNGAFERIGHHITDTLVRAPAALARFSAEMVKTGREAQDLATRLGGTTNEVQALLAAGQRLRIDTEDVGEALITLQENLGELARLGTGPAKDSLGSLGLTLQDFAGLGIEDRLKLFADALMGLEDPTKRLSIAMEVMGDDGKKLFPLLSQGAAGIDKLTKAARLSGQVLDEEAIAKTRELDLAVADMEAQLDGAAKKIMIALLPAAQDIAAEMQRWIANNDEFIKQDIPAIAHGIAEAFGVVSDSIARAARNVRFLQNEFDELVNGTALDKVQRVLDRDAREKKRSKEEAQNRANAIFDEEMAAVDAEIRRNDRATFEAKERGDLARKRRGGGGRGTREAADIGGSTAQAEMNQSLFQAMQSLRDKRRADAEARTDFAASMMNRDEFTAEQDKVRQFEQARAQIVLDQRMRGIETLRAQGADPIVMIDAEEQARVQYLETLRSQTDDEIELMRLKAQIEDEHHKASLARMAEEDKARQKQAALIQAHTEVAISGLTGIAQASISASLSGGQSVRAAVQGFAQAKAIEMAILAGSETARGIAALASPITAPLAAAHFNAAAVAAATGAGFGILAAATFEAGGTSAGVGAPGSFGMHSGAGAGRGAAGSRGAPPSAPISRSGAAGASHAVEGQGGPAHRSGGNTVVINLTQHGLGFGSKEETAAEVRRVLERSRQDVGGI